MSPRSSVGILGIYAGEDVNSSLGSIVRLELQTEDGAEYVNAELTRQKYLSLDIKVGSKVFVEPKNIKIFLNAQ